MLFLHTTHCEYSIPSSTAAKLPNPAFSTGFVINGTMYAYGGRLDGINFSNIAEPIQAQVYSFSQNTWTTLSGLDGIDSVPPHRQEHTAVRAANGLIYIHGGISSMNNFTLLRDHWSYDPIAGTFKNLTTAPISLYGSTATALPYVNVQQ